MYNNWVLEKRINSIDIYNRCTCNLSIDDCKEEGRKGTYWIRTEDNKLQDAKIMQWEHCVTLSITTKRAQFLYPMCLYINNMNFDVLSVSSSSPVFDVSYRTKEKPLNIALWNDALEAHSGSNAVQQVFSFLLGITRRHNSAGFAMCW